MQRTIRMGQRQLPHLLVLLLLVSTAASAADGDALRQAEALDALRYGGELERDWLTLGYYEARGNAHVSEIANDDFFVLAGGRRDPAGEYAAFVAAVAGFLRDGRQEELLCRYPSRLRLLRRHAGIGEFARSPACPDYAAFAQNDRRIGLSLVFASGYFDNPSSYYGHVLVRIEVEGDASDRYTLDTSLNYGANRTDATTSPLYVIRGLLGGYDASYTINNYFLHSYLYTSAQLRDTWEYPLLLDDEQQRFIVDHAFELLRARFPYYFFNDNCAHRIVRLVELAADRDLSSSHGFWLMPTQVIRHLGGRGEESSLIGPARYNASLKTQFTERYLALPAAERRALVDYFDAPEAERARLRAAASSELIRLELDYLDLEDAKLRLEEEASAPVEAIQAQRSALLGELFRRPPETESRATVAAPPIGPRDVRETSSLRVGGGVRGGDGYGTLSYRVANNDFLSPRMPGQEVSRFYMGDLELDVDAEGVDVHRLSLVEVVNLNTNPLPSRLTQERSWSLAFDYSQRSRLCSHCGDFGGESTIGRAARPTSATLLYGFAGARVHTRRRDDEFVTAVTRIGAVVDLGPDAVLHLGGRGHAGLLEGESDWVWSLDVAFNGYRRFDVRLGAERHGSDVAVVGSAAWFFD